MSEVAILGDSLLVQEGQPDDSIKVVELPLDTEETRETIRKNAYYKWQSAGSPAGNGENFWLEAEREVRKGIRTELRTPQE